MGEATAKLGDAAIDHHIQRRRILARSGQRVQGGGGGQAVGILIAHRDTALADPGQPFQIDVGAMAGAGHQFVCGEVRFG
nr:hypothetical protein [Mycobacterium shottsii]